MLGVDFGSWDCGIWTLRSNKELVIKYALFAVLAIFVNLAGQRLVLSFGESYVFYTLAIITGTGLGLVLKYYLDRKWIFYEVESDLKKTSKQFTLYTATGLVTTGIFWGTETIFWLVSQSDFYREVGAVIGLSIGYVTKYWLDMKFVFSGRNLPKGGVL